MALELSYFKRFALVSFSCLIFFINEQNTIAQAKSSESQFESPLKTAKKLVKKKRYRKAEKVLRKVIAEVPETEAYLLLAESLFFQKKRKEARAFFDRVPPLMLSNSNAYAWGMTYLRLKDWDRAIIGFKKVGKKSSYRGLAAYYLGFCYYKKKQWYTAKKFLKKADLKRLPSKLKRKRTQLLKMIQTNRDRELDRLVSGSGTVESDDPGEELNVDALLLPKFSVVEESKSKPKKYRLKGLATLTQLSRNLENHGFVNDTLDVGLTKVSGEYTGVFRPSAMKHLTLGLQVGAGYASLRTASTVATFITLQDTTGVFVQQENVKITEDYFITKLRPFLSLQISENQKLQVSLTGLLHMSQRSQFGDWGFNSGKVGYSLRLSQVRVKADVGLRNQFDELLDATVDETVLDLAAFFQFDDLEFFVKSKNISRQGELYINPSPHRTLLLGPSVNEIDGFQSITTFLIGSEISWQRFNLGLRLSQIKRGSDEEYIPRQNSTDLIDRHAKKVSSAKALGKVSIFSESSLFGKVELSQVGTFVQEVETVDGALSVFQTDADITSYSLGALFAPFSWLKLEGVFYYTEIYA